MLPFPKTHIQAQRIFKKKTAPVPFDASFIMTYPRRREYGCDEIFTTREMAHFYRDKDYIEYRRKNKLMAFMCPAKHCK